MKQRIKEVIIVFLGSFIILTLISGGNGAFGLIIGIMAAIGWDSTQYGNA